jgi:hypothetical protein
MPEQSWVVVETVNGSLQAELLRGLLKAQGIDVVLSQEGAGRALGLEVGPMGEVDILVSPVNTEEARKLIDDYYTGTNIAQDESE